MSVFAPEAQDSSTVNATQSSQTFALPTLATNAPAIRLVGHQGNQTAWWIKFGDNTVTVSETDSMKVFPGSHGNPLVLEVNNGETHIAIMCEGPPGDVTITGGGLYAGHDFGPIGASQIVAVTQSDQVIALPSLPVLSPVLALTEGGANMEALYLKFGDAMVAGGRDTSMKCMPGPIGGPLFVGVPAGVTHVSLFCDGDPGNLRLTPGAWRSGSIAVDRIDANTVSANNYIGIPSVSPANQAQQEAGTATDVYTSPGTQQFHPSAAKAWINFNGTGTIATRASYNVSGIADDGTGAYTISWDVDFSSADYAAMGSGGPNNVFVTLETLAAGSLSIEVRNDAGNITDAANVCLTAFGDQ